MNESQLSSFTKAVNHLRAAFRSPADHQAALVELYSEYASEQDLISLATKASQRALAISIEATEDSLLPYLGSLSAKRLIQLNRHCYEQVLYETAVVAAAALVYTEDYLNQYS